MTALRDQVRPFLALYIGGMGARGKNFYNDMAVAYGFGDAARTIQDLCLTARSGRPRRRCRTSCARR